MFSFEDSQNQDEQKFCAWGDPWAPLEKIFITQLLFLGSWCSFCLHLI